MHPRTARTGFAFGALLLLAASLTLVAANALTGKYDDDFTPLVATS